MSSRAPLYAIPKDPASHVYLQTEPPETNRLFSYHLLRCLGKAHSCGETALKSNGRFRPSSFHPSGTRCGLKDGDTIIAWKYTSPPLPETTDSLEEKVPSAQNKPGLVWKDFLNEWPQKEKPFHYQLTHCDQLHNTCGIAERTQEDRVIITFPACSTKIPLNLDFTEAYQAFDQWAYLKN